MVQQNLNFPETFWAGRRDSEVNFVDNYIPFFDKCSTPKVEKWRKYQNMYYRFFNDGDKPNYFSMNALAKSVGLQWRGLYLVPSARTTLEQIGDCLLDDALKEIKAGIAPKLRGI
jgi:hypothetical protein